MFWCRKMAKIILFLLFSSVCHAGILKITMFPLIHGDQILIELPNKEVMLLDTGKPGKIEKFVGRYIQVYKLSVDYLVLTHPHNDHIGDAATAIRMFQPKEVWDNGHAYPGHKPYEAYQEALREYPTFVYRPKRGDIREIGEVKFVFLHPKRSYVYENYNNNSLVFKLIYGETSILFTGDAEKPVQADLVNELRPTLKADALKIPHHGVADSFYPEFIDAVKPRLSFCPCAPIMPSNAQTKHLKKYGPIFNVRDRGIVTINSDGLNVWAF